MRRRHPNDRDVKDKAIIRAKADAALKSMNSLIENHFFSLTQPEMAEVVEIKARLERLKELR